MSSHPANARPRPSVRPPGLLLCFGCLPSCNQTRRHPGSTIADVHDGRHPLFPSQCLHIKRHWVSGAALCYAGRCTGKGRDLLVRTILTEAL